MIVMIIGRYDDDAVETDLSLVLAKRESRRAVEV
jgi:hypothetical protein